MSIRSVISKLGGISATARGLGHRNVTTVQGWWDRELIPAHRQREVLDYAASIDVAVSPDEIIPPARRAVCCAQRQASDQGAAA